jgi:energy-coupling factor transporter ATP-binding protein EcfA2
LTPFSQKGAVVEQCDRDQMVNYALYVLKLQDVADKQISDLNSQQKKRTTMGVELVSDPAILYLDEPTSGLDSVAALTVMDCIKTIKESGVTVIVTIHQPSESLYDYFDMLLLLKKGGHEIYFGPCPKRPEGDDDNSRFAQGFRFFQNMNKAPEWRQQNPADYILDFCVPGDYDKQFQGSPLGEKMKEWIQGGEKYNSQPHQYYMPGKDLKTPTFGTPYALSMGEQMKAMYIRGATHYWRNPDYTFTRMMVSLLTALFLGLTYYDLDNDASGCQYKVASIFLMIVLQVPYFLLAMSSIFEMKAVHFRERKSMNYQERAYFGVLSFVEYPYIIFSINVFMWIAHLLVGYNKAGSRMFFYWIFLSAFQIFMVFYGQMVAALTPSPEVAQKIASILTAVALLNAGFMLHPSKIPYGWKFLYWWSPYHYAIEALGANELEGMTCGAEAGEPLGSMYIQETFSLEFDNRWRNFGIIIGYALFCRIVTLLALKYNETIKR